MLYVDKKESQRYNLLSRRLILSTWEYKVIAPSFEVFSLPLNDV